MTNDAQNGDYQAVDWESNLPRSESSLIICSQDQPAMGAAGSIHDDPATIDAAGIMSREELRVFDFDVALHTLGNQKRIAMPIP